MSAKEIVSTLIHVRTLRKMVKRKCLQIAKDHQFLVSDFYCRFISVFKATIYSASFIFIDIILIPLTSHTYREMWKIAWNEILLNETIFWSNIIYFKCFYFSKHLKMMNTKATRCHVNPLVWNLGIYTLSFAPSIGMQHYDI